MGREAENVFEQYIDAIDMLADVPSELKNMLEAAEKNHSDIISSLDDDKRQVQARIARLRESAESEYSKTQKLLAKEGVPIPERQRSGTSGASQPLAQAFDNQKKSAEEILRIIAEIRAQKDQAAKNTRSAAEALNRRRELAQQRLKEEESEAKNKAKRKLSFNIGNFNVTIKKKDESEE